MDVNVGDYGIFSKDLKAYLGTMCRDFRFSRLTYRNNLLGKNGSVQVKTTIDRAMDLFYYKDASGFKFPESYYYLLINTSISYRDLKNKYEGVFNNRKGDKNYQASLFLLNFYFICNMISKLNPIQLLSLRKNKNSGLRPTYLIPSLYEDLLWLVFKFKIKDLFVFQSGSDIRLEQYIFNNMENIIIDVPGIGITDLKHLIKYLKEEK